MNEYMINFCCSQLSSWFYNAGSKGFSAIPKLSEDDSYTIFLQSRNQDVEVRDGMLSVGQQAISYCPFCGTKLSKVIKRNKEGIEFYAKKNIDLLI
jgi:hypothetical protein